MDVTYIVSGNVRYQNDQLKVTVVTERTTDLSHIDRRQYDLSLQGPNQTAQELGQLIARRTLKTFNRIMSNIELIEQTDSVEAIRLLMLGWASDADPKTRIAYFKQSIVADPTFDSKS